MSLVVLWTVCMSRSAVQAAADWKQRSPSPNRVDVRVIVSVGTSEERRWRRPAAVTSWQSLARYGGSRAWIALYDNGVSLNSVHCLTGSHCSCCRTGVMWSWRRFPHTRRAAAFCTDWRHCKGKGKGSVFI